MEPTNFYVAQINIGRITGTTIEDPVMADFVAQLDTINELAEKSEGFVWRLKSADNNATSFNPYNDQQIIINFSVWETIEHLDQFVYKSAHTIVMKDRKKWFEKFGQPYMALWYVPAGYTPTIEEAAERLDHLQKNGPSEYAFDFRNPFSRPIQSPK